MMVKIIEIKAEMGGGTRGASLGIDALKIAGINAKSSLFRSHESIVIENTDMWSLENTAYPHAKFIDVILPLERRVSTAVYKTLLNKHIPIVMTGDHSYACGIIAGIKKANANKRLGVVWVDAHADLHSPYTTPSGNMHGMPIAMACNIDNTTYKINDPDAKTLAYWQQIKDIGVPGAKIRPEDVVYIGMRSIEKGEQHIIDRHAMSSIAVDEVRKQGAKKMAGVALDALQHCDLIYVSFDVDSISSSFSKGTGTPVANGLTLEEAKLLNQELVKTPKLCAWEVTEINPILDSENKMAEGVFKIMEKVARAIEKNAYATL